MGKKLRDQVQAKMDTDAAQAHLYDSSLKLHWRKADAHARRENGLDEIHMAAAKLLSSVSSHDIERSSLILSWRE